MGIRRQKDRTKLNQMAKNSREMSNVEKESQKIYKKEAKVEEKSTGPAVEEGCFEEAEKKKKNKYSRPR